MRRVCVVGGGHTKFCFNTPKSGIELFSEAATEAMSLSNLKPKDIQALYMGNVFGDIEEGQSTIQTYAANDMGCLNIPASRFEGACASATIAIRDAAAWVGGGYFDIVLAGGTAPSFPLPCSCWIVVRSPTVQQRLLSARKK